MFLIIKIIITCVYVCENDWYFWGEEQQDDVIFLTKKNATMEKKIFLIRKIRGKQTDRLGDS